LANKKCIEWPIFSVVFMKQNQNPRHNRQGRPGQHNKPNQHNNQKRNGKGRHNSGRQQQQPNSSTRQVDSRGPAGSLRGNAKQLYEKYKALAQEKRATDRLEFEALSQHADHYYRIYAEFAAAEAAVQVKREQERARKAEIEVEQRANTVSAEQAAQDIPPEIKTEPKKVVTEAPAPEAKEEKVTEEVTEKPEVKTEEQVETPPPSKKRRGRPPKVKTEAEA